MVLLHEGRTLCTQGFVRVLGWGTDQCRVAWGYSRDGLYLDPPMILGSASLSEAAAVHKFETAYGVAVSVRAQGKHLAMAACTNEAEKHNTVVISWCDQS